MLLNLTIGICCFFLGAFVSSFFLRNIIIDNTKYRRNTEISSRGFSYSKNKEILLDSNPELIRVTDLESEDLERYFDSITKRQANLPETANRALRAQDATIKHRITK